MFRIVYCCTILVLFSVDGSTNSVIKSQCRAGVCDDRPLCPQSPCRCLYPSKVDCAFYYQCVQGKPYQHRCSQGLLFNEDTLTCDYDFNVNCSTGQTTRKDEESTGTITRVTGVTVSEIPKMSTVNGNYTSSDHPRRSVEPQTEPPSNDESEKYSTKIYNFTTPNEIPSTERITTKSSNLSIGTANNTLTITQSESYSKPTVDMTTDSSTKQTMISIFPTDSSFDISSNTTFSKSSDFVTEITNPTSTAKKNTKYTLPTKEDNTTNPIPINEESEAPDASKSTPTVSEEPETSSFPSTAKESEKPETTNLPFVTKSTAISEAIISRSTVKQSEEPETIITPSTTREIEEPETTIFTFTGKESQGTNPSSKTKEREEIETTSPASPAKQSEELETSSFRSTIATTSKPASIIDSTGVTEHSLPTEVTNDLQNRNWTCPSRFGLFPDKRDCNKFYHCSHWKPYLKRCPSNLHFNPELQVCDWPEDAKCGEPLTTSASIETSATTEQETSSNISCNCNFCLLPVPDDCNAYTMCTNGSSKVIVCGRGLYFNAMTETCDLEDNLPCENNVQCPESSGLFPYPHSCVHYMDCQNFEITVKICPKGMTFDKDNGECSAGESCDDMFVSSTSFQYSDSTNHMISETTPSENVTQSINYENHSTFSKTETINNINDTTVMDTATTFITKAKPITKKYTTTDKSNTASEKMSSIFSTTKDTTNTGSKFTPENVTKNKELSSTPYSDSESEFPTTDEVNVTRKVYSTVVSSISPKSETTTHSDSIMTETIIVPSKVTSAETMSSDETSVKFDITSPQSKVSGEPSTNTEIVSDIPDEISSATDTPSHSTTLIDETSTSDKTASSPTTIQDIILTETISPAETIQEKEVSIEIGTSSSVVSKETEIFFTYISTKLETTPFSVTEINTKDISAISNADTFSKTETITNLSTTISKRETATIESSSNQNNETTKEKESYSVLPEITTPEGISSNDTTQFECPKRFGLYPDSKSCFRFYHCSHWTAYHKTCPSKLHFNPILQVCDWPHKAGCSITGSTTIPELSITTPFQQTTNDERNNEVFCACDSCELPIPDDCNSYILCIDKSATRISCGSGLNFNVKTGTCDWENNVVCEMNTKCPQPTGRFPYPHSCYHYMDCNNTVLTVKKCPEGMVYNKSEERCSWTAICEDVDTPIETTSSANYEGTTIWKISTPSPYSTEIVKETSTKDTYMTYTDYTNSKLSSISINRTTSTASLDHKTSTKLTKEPAETSSPFQPVTTSKEKNIFSSSFSTDYGTMTTSNDPSSDQTTKSDEGERTTSSAFTNADTTLTSKPHETSENENNTTIRITVSSSTEIFSTSNQDFVSARSSPTDLFSTKTLRPDSSTKTTTTDKISTKSHEHSSSTSNTNSFKTASSITNATIVNPLDFTNASTKGLVTIILPSTEISKLLSTEDPSAGTELNEFSTNTVSKITEDHQKHTTVNDSEAKISTTEAGANSSFICPSRVGLFPDPDSCFRFYHCSHWVAHYKSCPSHLHFNPKSQVCDWPYRAGCGESPITPTEITQLKENDIILNQICDCECCFYPNKTDCSRYMMCLDGVLHEGQCAEGLLFNHLDSNCDIAQRVTCPQTSPSCPSQNGIYPHPTLCTAFYRCVNWHPFLEYCPEDEHFKSSEIKCVDPCDANCDKTLSCNTPHPQTGVSTSPVCIDRNGLYPAEDCSSYYMCAEGHAYFVKCPDGLHFNIEYGVCEPPCDAGCDLTIDCPTSIQYASSKSLDIHSLHCPRPNGLFPAAEECGAFYLCSQGKAHLFHCPPGLHYSSKDESCETPCSAQCDKNIDCTLLKSGRKASEDPRKNLISFIHFPLFLLCKAVSDETLPNPQNCSSFYKCSDGKARLTLCPKGFHFDPEEKKCKSPCLAGCDPSIQCPTEIPAPKGKCSCENCYLQDPTDCSAFLFCSHGFLTKGYCLRGMLFDRLSNNCRNASEVVCEAIGDPTMCREPSGTFSYPGNCNKFIQCKDWVAHIMDCENEMEFDPLLRTCANPKGDCDQIGKDPFCETTTGYFAHPENSSLFYRCENGFKYLKSCSAPLIYNALDQVCDWPHNVQDKSIKETLKIQDSKHAMAKYRPALSSYDKSSDSNGMTCHVVPGVTCPCACRVTTYDDCESFYHCTGKDKACKKRCPEGLYFNRKTRVCDLPQNVECRDFFFASLRRLKSRNSAHISA